MRRPKRPGVAFLPLLAAGFLLCVSARAADSPEQKLKSVEQQLDETRKKEAQFAKQADALAAEITRLRDDSIAAAQAAQEREVALSTLEDQLISLNAGETHKLEELRRHRAKQTQLLMALERLALNPPENLALASGDPLDAMHSAVLMGAAVPPLEAGARALRQEISALASLRQQITEAEARHRRERLGLDKERMRLAALITRKALLQKQAQEGAEESGQRERQLASQVADLQQLIERLSAERRAREAEAQKRREEQERQARLNDARPAPRGGTVEVTAPPAIRPDPSKPKVIRSFAKARGLVIFPSSGRLTRRYGEPDELGVTSKGLTFETRAGAQVVAPFDGHVLFAGPFRGYGQILIIEHRDGYHSLLAGLDRVDGRVGQWLVAGEPIGTMPKSEANPRLYLELRHDGQPINPLPWLATRNEKVNG